jgi:hypothetical protein
MSLQIKNHTLLNESQELCLPARTMLLQWPWPSGVNGSSTKATHAFITDFLKKKGVGARRLGQQVGSVHLTFILRNLNPRELFFSAAIGSESFKETLNV